MKIKHLFGLAVIAAMTASCSSNEDLGTAGSGTGTNESGVSYASITINLPTANGTRATTNDQFNGGTPSEYAVNDATLLIFEKGTETSENNFKFVEAVPLGNLEPWKKDNTANNGITTEATITAELNSATVDKDGGKYYALVILNNETATGTKITLPTAPITYGKWNVAANTTNITDYEKGFYMANAPEFTTKDVEPTTLVKIEGIYRTKEEAQSKPGTTVHVERGLAKVTVGSNSTGKNYFATEGDNATGTNYKSDKVQITNWALDVTNKSSFPVHVTSGLKAGTTISEGQDVTGYEDIWKNAEATAGTAPATSRFVSNSTTATFKRVYWGIDPNYSMGLTDLDKCKEQFTLATDKGTVVKWMNGSGSDNPLYCLENTFDINNMKQGQTTRVLVKATYTPNVLASESGTDKTFFMIGNSLDIWTTKTLKDQIASKAKEALRITTDPTVELTGDLLTAGTHVLTKSNVSIKIKEGETETEKVDDKLVATLNTKLGLDKDKGIGIKTYKNGESYYIARIKHFGDDLTPWKAGDATYDGKNLNWLGRYGVLRNNWYDLTINSISGPGYPDVPEVKPKSPDDEDTKYINVSVKILDWAKRSQNVNL